MHDTLCMVGGRRKALNWSCWCLSLMLFTLLAVHEVSGEANEKEEEGCASRCGNFTNIKHPFRLRHDPPKCGKPKYELACENNVTLLYLYSGKYRVLGINYHNYTIRIVDPGIQQANCSSLPRHFLYQHNLSDSYYYSNTFNDSEYQDPYRVGVYDNNIMWEHIIYLKCRKAVVRNDSGYVDTGPCLNSASEGHMYALIGDLMVGNLRDECEVKLMTMVSWNLGNKNLSYGEIHRVLSFGFEISWWPAACNCSNDDLFCYFNSTIQDAACLPDGCFTPMGPQLQNCDIEDFLQLHDLMPVRYSYKDLKMMTKGFKTNIGQGGFGTVYQGKLRSGPLVAVKMLGKSKHNGQEFISEVATIGRIHHFNVVHLIGFCVEGSKRALVYEFMRNGSLDKYIFSKEGNTPLNYDKIYEISLGVARGIAYLHHGCDMQILHFDIKPHNILLDDNFTPKISDFGLAKLYPVDDSIVTLTAARGTIGYMAPELFYQNIGGVSYKADVYSFGMLLMEMASQRKNLNPHAEHSSQLYFPLWIHDQFTEEKDIEMEDLTQEEKNLAKKMFIVALWCIQLKPSDRPSMKKVVEMLEGEVESLEIPPKPSFYPHEAVVQDDRSNYDQTSSIDSMHTSSNSGEIVRDEE
ncbi:rust resistance kinase Lr10-like [Senna tora]|uniref:Rust resistance kinase Lr10-like n=1 Tax=Senna tora TaxID=362788 RepID=A0A834WQZ6_9FABA|nr:rust resistance kinase Lr10-like [Senna tora]